MVERDNWAERFDATGRELIPATPSPTEVINEIATSDGPSAATQQLAENPRTDNSPPVPAKSKGFSGLPDWSDKPRDAATGQFISPKSDAGLVASLGLTAEVAGVLSAQPGGLAAAADNLRDSMSRIWGDNAAQVAEWAAELSPAAQVKCLKVVLGNPHLSGKEIAKRVRQTLTLDEAAEIERWLTAT
jgi:hypothetical protein